MKELLNESFLRIMTVIDGVMRYAQRLECGRGTESTESQHFDVREFDGTVHGALDGLALDGCGVLDGCGALLGGCGALDT